MSFASVTDFEHTLVELTAPDDAAIAAALARQSQLTKPAGSLGRLEDIAVFFAGWQGRERPVIERGRVVGKHGEESGMRSVIMGQGRMICLIAIGMHLPVCGGISNWAP